MAEGGEAKAEASPAAVSLPLQQQQLLQLLNRSHPPTRHSALSGRLETRRASQGHSPAALHTGVNGERGLYHQGPQFRPLPGKDRPVLASFVKIWQS